MNKPNLLLKLATIASSLLLVGGLVSFRAGALSWLAPANAQADEPKDPPKTRTGALMFAAGTKSSAMLFVAPPAPKVSSAQRQKYRATVTVEVELDEDWHVFDFPTLNYSTKRDYSTSFEIDGALDLNSHVFDRTPHQFTNGEELDQRIWLPTRNSRIPFEERFGKILVRYRQREWLLPPMAYPAVTMEEAEEASAPFITGVVVRPPPLSPAIRR